MEAAFSFVPGCGDLWAEGGRPDTGAQTRRRCACVAFRRAQRATRPRRLVRMQAKDGKNSRPALHPKSKKGRLNEVPKEQEVLSDHVQQTFLDLSDGNLASARASFAEMCRCPVAPAEKTYGSLLLGFAKLGSNEDAELVFAEAQERLKGGPSVEMYNCLVRCYTRQGDEKGALDAYARMQEDKVRPNGRTFYDMMNTFVMRRSAESAGFLMKEMKRLRLRKDKHLFKAILKYYSMTEDTDNLELTCYDMCESYGMKLDVETFNIRVNALANANELRLAEDVLEEMKDRMLRPDELTFTSIIRGHCRAKDAEKVRLAFLNMKRHKARPNVITFRPIFELMDELSDLAGARYYLKEMRIAKVRMTTSIYNSMISLYIQASDLPSAIETVRRMQQFDIQPIRSTYLALLGAFADADERLPGPAVIFAAWQAQHDLERDLYLESLLLDAYLRNGQLRSARALWIELARRGEALKTVLYNVVVRNLCTGDRVEAAERIVQQMKLRDVPCNYRTYAPLLVAYASRADVANVTRLLEDMREEELFPRWEVRNALWRAQRADPRFYRLKVLTREMDAELIDAMKREQLIPKKRIRKMLFLKRETQAKVWKMFEEYQVRYNRVVDRRDGELFERPRYFADHLAEFGERSEDAALDQGRLDLAEDDEYEDDEDEDDGWESASHRAEAAEEDHDEEDHEEEDHEEEDDVQLVPEAWRREAGRTEADAEEDQEEEEEEEEEEDNVQRVDDVRGEDSSDNDDEDISDLRGEYAFVLQFIQTS